MAGMQKRQSSDRVNTVRSAILIALGSLGGLLVIAGIYFSTDLSKNTVPQAGVDYEVISTIERPRARGPIVVEEFFSYGCIHCRNFEPTLKAWAGTPRDDVTFSRRPASFSPSWALLGRAYLALAETDTVDALHQSLFSAVHDRGIQFRSAEQIAEFLDGTTLTADEFLRAFNSPSVRRGLSRADSDMRRFGINSVPTMVIAGKYRVTMDNGNQRALEVTDYLIEQERAARATPLPGAD